MHTSSTLGALLHLSAIASLLAIVCFRACRPFVLILRCVQVDETKKNAADFRVGWENSQILILLPRGHELAHSHRCQPIILNSTKHAQVCHPPLALTALCGCTSTLDQRSVVFPREAATFFFALSALSTGRKPKPLHPENPDTTSILLESYLTEKTTHLYPLPLPLPLPLPASYQHVHTSA